jgi:hypothetical protein
MTSLSQTIWTCFKVDEDVTDFDNGTQLWLQGIGPLEEEAELIQASWYGKYGWTTWSPSKEEALREAMASKSRGITTTEGLKPTVWLLFSLEIDQVKAYELLIIHRAVTPAKERNEVLTWRIHGDVVLKEYKYRKHLMRVDALAHDHWADVQIGTYYKDKGAQECKQCGETHATWAKYCSVCWRDHLYTEEKRKATQRHLIEDVKECRLALNSSMQAIAEHEHLDHEGVLEFLSRHIDDENVVDTEDTVMDMDE